MRPSPKPKKRKPAYAAKPNPAGIGAGGGPSAANPGKGGGGHSGPSYTPSDSPNAIQGGAGVAGAHAAAHAPAGTSPAAAGSAAAAAYGPSGTGKQSSQAPSYDLNTYSGITSYAQQVLGLSPSEASIVPYAQSAGQKYGVSPALLMGLMENQSGLKPQARIGRESGLGMFGPQSRKDYGVKEGDDEVAVKTQVNGLAKMLSESGVNENPREAIAMWARGEHRGFAEKVIQTAEHYEALDPQKPQGSINAQLGGQGVQAAQRAAATQQPSPVNTERPAPGQPVRRDPNDPMDGPVNTERPDPRSGDSLRALNPALKTINQALAQVNGTQPTPEQKARVEQRLQRAVDRSGGRFLDGTLNPDQQEWAKAFAKELGVSLDFAAAEALREGGNGTPGDNNWANIGWTDSGPTAITRDPVWQDPAAAGKATADWIRGKFGQKYGYVAADGIQQIGRLADAGASEQEIGKQWANSGWASAGAGPLDTLGQVPISEGGDVPGRLKARAREILGKLNTQAIVKGIDTSAAQKINDPVQRRAVKQIMVTGRVTQEDARVLGPAAAKALARGGNLVNAPSGKHKLVAAEMFYDGGGSYYDSGTWTEGQFGGHGDHVHFASEDPISMMLVVKKAQELGMLQGGVGENPAYDTIDAHDPNSGSYHVRSEPMPNGPYAKKLEKATGASGDVIGQAIDIAGSPEQMGQMRDWIAAHIGKDATLTGPKIKGTDLMVVEPAPEATPTEGLSGASGSSLPGLAGATGGWTQREFKKNGSALPAQPTGINASSAGAIFGKSFAGMNPELVPSLAGVLPASSEGDGSSMIDALVRVSNPRRRVRTR